MNEWLDRWDTKRLREPNLPQYWVACKAKILPLEHTKKILLFGKKAYRKWESEGFPEDFKWERIPNGVGQ
jgi:hypothetical protein